MKKTNNFRATSVEIYQRETPITSDDKKIYLRERDNLYPLRVEGIINNSPTGRRCANMMAKFIAGGGVENDFIINKRGETLGDIITQSADCLAYQYGVFFLIKYKIDEEKVGEGLHFKVGSIEVLDYIRMAKSKEDDNGEKGKYYLLEFEENKNIFKKVNHDTAWFYSFNQNQEIIKAQMLNDCKKRGIETPTIQEMLQHHRGQVYYLNLTPNYTYALPLADSVYNDCDTEYRMSLYNNRQTRSGFLGKTIISKFKEDEFENFNEDRPKPHDRTFNDEIKDSLGAEGSSDVLIIEVPVSATDDLKKAFVVESVKPQFDDKLFTNLEQSTKRKIMGAFNNIPEALVFGGDGALFGTNAEAYKEMKKFYWEQNEKERKMLENALYKIIGIKVGILPIVNEETLNTDEELRKKSQAELKGSVGGVSALLEIQKSVSQGTTDINSAVEIIKEIFGIEETIARKMLGTPDKVEENE